MFCGGGGGEWDLAACLDDNWLVGVSVLKISDNVISSSSSIDSWCILVVGGRGAAVGERRGGGGVIKVCKCDVQQQQQQQPTQQQQQQQPAAKLSLRHLVKGDARLPKKELAGMQVAVGRVPLACILMRDAARDLHVQSTLGVRSSSSAAGVSSPSKAAAAAPSLLSPSTHSLLLHITTSRSFSTLNLSPLPSLQHVHHIAGTAASARERSNRSLPRITMP